MIETAEEHKSRSAVFTEEKEAIAMQREALPTLTRFIDRASENRLERMFGRLTPVQWHRGGAYWMTRVWQDAKP